MRYINLLTYLLIYIDKDDETFLCAVTQRQSTARLRESVDGRISIHQSIHPHIVCWVVIYIPPATENQSLLKIITQLFPVH